MFDRCVSYFFMTRRQDLGGAPGILVIDEDSVLNGTPRYPTRSSIHDGDQPRPLGSIAVRVDHGPPTMPTKKPTYLYVPSTFDPEKHLPEHLRKHADSARYFLHRIIWGDLRKQRHPG